MRFATAPLPFLAIALFVGSASAADEPSGLPRCITMTSDARSAGGTYDHIVSFTNTCGARASCTVSTDVKPDPVWVDLPDQLATEVVILKGSSESAFRPSAFCVVNDR
jgi:hypothetical protein